MFFVKLPLCSEFKNSCTFCISVQFHRVWYIKSLSLQDEKDLKVRELTMELHREKKKSAAYQQQLQLVLKYIEEHTQRLSLKAEVVTSNMRELESEEQDSAQSD